MHRSMPFQLIMARLDGGRIGDARYEAEITRLVRQGIGGFILFGGDKEQVVPFVRHLQTVAEIPLFIASDTERGVGQQIRGTTRFPSQMAVAAAINRNDPGDIALLDRALDAWSSEARHMGINMVFTPVLDVNLNPANPIICTRAFSDDPRTVSWFGKRYIAAFVSWGLLGCAKHFPGHGDTAMDSHISLPLIDKELEDLWAVEFRPFADAIDAGVPCIMAGHIVMPSVDSLPASLSPSVIERLLRGRMGFKGLVITDALNMSALTDYERIAPMSLQAGADVLLHPADPESTLREVLDAVEKSVLDAQIIEKALTRILGTKKMIAAGFSGSVDYAAHREIADALFARAVTVVKDAPGLKNRPLAAGRLLVPVGDTFDHATSPLRAIPLAPDDVGGRDVLIAIFSAIAAWKGTSGLSRKESDRILSVIRKARSSVVVSFGSPYILDCFRNADMLLAAYDDAEGSQKAILNWLFSPEKAHGTCPVRIRP